jgi:hypothetical protein
MQKHRNSGLILKNIIIKQQSHTIKRSSIKKLLKFIQAIFGIVLFKVSIYKSWVKFAICIKMKAWN